MKPILDKLPPAFKEKVTLFGAAPFDIAHDMDPKDYDMRFVGQHEDFVSCIPDLEAKGWTVNKVAGLVSVAKHFYNITRDDGRREIELEVQVSPYPLAPDSIDFTCNAYFVTFIGDEHNQCLIRNVLENMDITFINKKTPAKRVSTHDFLQAPVLLIRLLKLESKGRTLCPDMIEEAKAAVRTLSEEVDFTSTEGFSQKAYSHMHAYYWQYIGQIEGTPLHQALGIKDMMQTPKPKRMRPPGFAHLDWRGPAPVRHPSAPVPGK